ARRLDGRSRSGIGGDGFGDEPHFRGAFQNPLKWPLGEPIVLVSSTDVGMSAHKPPLFDLAPPHVELPVPVMLGFGGDGAAAQVVTHESKEWSVTEAAAVLVQRQ